MASVSVKHDASSSTFEVESSKDQYTHSQTKKVSVIEAARVSVSALALLCAITIMGLSADAIKVYSTTRLEESFQLSLWPDSFGIQPTVALLVGSIFVALAEMVDLLFSKVPQLRKRTQLSTPVMFAAPLVGFVAVLVAIIVFYTTHASTTTDSLLSWTCRWRALDMKQAPYFGILCGQSWASVYLAVVLLPIEVIALCAAVLQFKVQKQASAYARARKGSPVA